MSFQVLPLPKTLADKARRTGKAPGYGHPVHLSVATAEGYGPCRLCLRRFREGERRLLMTYNPYPEPGEVPVVGPVFIHAEGCEAYAGTGLPEELRGLPLVAQGHFRGGEGLINRRLEGERPEAVLEALFEQPHIAFITLRNAEAGCFIARVVRGEERPWP